MGSLFRSLMGLPLLRPILRPITRVLIGAIAIPIFRFILRHVFRLQELDDELEKDLEEWFRGSLLLLAATANMEHLLFDWAIRWDWLTIGLRLLLAIGVVEAMPDQELFAVIHPGPPKLKPSKGILKELWREKWPIFKGVICQHLNRSSPVFAIMAAIFGAQLSDEMTAEDYRRWVVGWSCYGIAITQYLIIGLVTSRDRAMDVLSEFDRAVAQRRRELIEEFHLDPKDKKKKSAEADAVKPAEEKPAADPDGSAEPKVPDPPKPSADTPTPPNHNGDGLDGDTRTPSTATEPPSAASS